MTDEDEGAMGYRLMGETEHGILRIRSFGNREAAESHPVVMSKWKRVWIEPIRNKVEIAARQPSWRTPWIVDEPSGYSFTYIRDADGSRLMSLTGSHSERQRTIAVLRERGLVGEP